MPQPMAHQQPQLNQQNRMSYKQVLVGSVVTNHVGPSSAPYPQSSGDSLARSSPPGTPQIANDIVATTKDNALTHTSPRCVSIPHPITASPLKQHLQDPFIHTQLPTPVQYTVDDPVIIASDGANTAAIDALRQQSADEVDEVYDAFHALSSAKEGARSAYHRVTTVDPILPTDTPRASGPTDDAVQSAVRDVHPYATHAITTNQCQPPVSAQLHSTVMPDEFAPVSVREDVNHFASVSQPQPLYNAHLSAVHTTAAARPTIAQEVPQCSPFSGPSPQLAQDGTTSVMFGGGTLSYTSSEIPTTLQQQPPLSQPLLQPSPQPSPLHTYSTNPMPTATLQYAQGSLQPLLHTLNPPVSEAAVHGDVSAQFVAPIINRPLPPILLTPSMTHVQGLMCAHGCACTSLLASYGMQQRMAERGVLPSSAATDHSDHARLGVPTQVMPGMNFGFVSYDNPFLPAVHSLPPVTGTECHGHLTMMYSPLIFPHGPGISLPTSFAREQIVRCEAPAVPCCFEHGCCRIAEDSIHPPLPKVTGTECKARKEHFTHWSKNSKRNETVNMKGGSIGGADRSQSGADRQVLNRSSRKKKKSTKAKEMSQENNDEAPGVRNSGPQQEKKSLLREESRIAKMKTKAVNIREMSFPPLPRADVESTQAMGNRTVQDERKPLTETKENLTFKEVVERTRAERSTRNSSSKSA